MHWHKSLLTIGCCWSRFEISPDLFRQNRNHIFFFFFSFHITMNNRIRERDTRVFIYLLFYARPLIVTKLRENEFTNSIHGATRTFLRKRKISRVDNHRVYKVSCKDGPTNHRNRNNSRERPHRFRGGPLLLLSVLAVPGLGILLLLPPSLPSVYNKALHGESRAGVRRCPAP